MAVSDVKLSTWILRLLSKVVDSGHLKFKPVLSDTSISDIKHCIMCTVQKLKVYLHICFACERQKIKRKLKPCWVILVALRAHSKLRS